MVVHQEDLRFSTKGPRDMHDITGDVAAAVSRSGVRTGWVHVFNVGSTGAIGAIEFA